MDVSAQNQMWNEQEDGDEAFFGHYGYGSNDPKQSPMRHKAKFRMKDDHLVKKKKGRKRLTIDKFDLLLREE
jgi:hypothetical protein